MRSAFLLAAVLGAASLAAAQAAELSLEDAVERVQKETAGRVLTAEEVHIGKKKIYRIKVLTRDGRVRVLQLAADPVDAGDRDTQTMSSPKSG